MNKSGTNGSVLLFYFFYQYLYVDCVDYGVKHSPVGVNGVFFGRVA